MVDDEKDVLAGGDAGGSGAAGVDVTGGNTARSEAGEDDCENIGLEGG